MIPRTTLGRRAAMAAIYLERYGLSLVYLGLAGYQLHQMWVFDAAERAALGTNPLVGIAQQIIRMQLNGYIGVMLLLGARVTVPPQNFKDLFIPLAATFFNLLYNAVTWLPAGCLRNLCPPDWQAPCVAAGLGLNLLGLAVAIWGAVYLGRSFGVFIEVKQVVMAGPYAWVRHPMYAGYLCLMGGLVLVNFSLAYFILVPVHGALLVYRARLEEARLAESSPAYREYRQRTGCLFPKISQLWQS